MGNAADSDGRYLKDGLLSFIGGADASVPASDINRNQVASAVNCSFRRGICWPRPAMIKKKLTFAEGIEDAFKNALFQHGAFYDGNGYPSLMSSHGGRIFRTDAKTFAVTEITPTTTRATTTAADFIIPDIGDIAALMVESTANMYAQLSSLTIGGNVLALVSVDSIIQITVRNAVDAQSAQTILSGTSISFTGYDFNSPILPIAWSVQARNYWVLQDNQSYAIIWDGSGSRRADPDQDEIPVGNVMGVSMGRLIVALPDRVTFRVGNLVFGDGTFENILNFDENNYLNEGGDFVARVFDAPSNSGEIRAIVSGAMTDTQLGQGPCQIGTPHVVFTIALPFDRTTWKNSTNVLQTVNPIKGPLGQCSTIQHNSDLYYRALDGDRSYILAQRQFNTDGNTPVSGEVNYLLDNDTQSLLEHGSSVLFHNQRLLTFGPAQSQRGVWHRGLVVRDFEAMSSSNRSLGAIWNGAWVGQRILHIVVGMIDNKERCFMWVLNDAQEIEIWEFDTSAINDEGNVPISRSFDLPSFNCGDSDRFKMLITGRFIISGLVGNLDVVVKYRTDLSPCYQPWDSVTVCAKYQDCAPPVCLGPHTYQEQQRTPIKLRVPPDGFDPISGIKYRTGYEFQPRIELSGHAGIRQFRLYTLDTPESLARDRSAAERVIYVPMAMIDASGQIMLDASGQIILSSG